MRNDKLLVTGHFLRRCNLRPPRVSVILFTQPFFAQSSLNFCKAVSCPRLLVYVRKLRNYVFNPRSVRVEFVVDKIAVVLLRVLRFSSVRNIPPLLYIRVSCSIQHVCLSPVSITKRRYVHDTKYLRARLVQESARRWHVPQT